ncbi:uncharacterized protein N7506_005166 [Penicillium brevicompactum]|uniref:uncharacterized protein n=1 Tax=Penicillium brevicompactum TaxID=5074 RepID=UPI00253F9FA7|nr:uncharacterized protein N7506_005166 [Penicillium brevicompactum]KAJ5337144.1 hypothetical protein N7506_005166 [Penicillium brevicompactum]
MGFFKRERMLGECSWNSNLITNDVDCIGSERAIELIVADYAMREHVQREETKNHRAIASRKAATIDCDQSWLREEDETLEQEKKQFRETERALYRALCLLGRGNQQKYHDLRSNPTWYMNEGLVQDCSEQGGCCSRQCGCCAKRHLTGLKKGVGHCTPECWCCTSFRGSDLSENEKKEIRDDMEAKLRWRTENYRSLSPYLLTMATWFLFPPKAKKKAKRIC